MPRFIQEIQLKELMLRKQTIQLASCSECNDSRETYRCPSPHSFQCKKKFENFEATYNAITLLRNHLWEVSVINFFVIIVLTKVIFIRATILVIEEKN
jgi:hypothetical protein